MSTGNIEALLALPMQLGESPVWHPKEQALYWIDIAGLAVHRFQMGAGLHRLWPLPAEPGCIALAADGRLIVAMRSGVAFLDTATGVLAPIADPPYDPGLMRFNDGRCDGRGRLWAGTAYDARDKALGSLYCIERGALRDIGLPVTVSNGVAFSLDQRTLYHADTSAHRITAYDFDLDTGTIGSARIFKEFPSERGKDYGGRPDGAAVDSEDAYWCAMYEGGRLLRIAPSGAILNQIPLPVRCPTMLAFGGDDLRTLFITTVRHKRPAEELAAFPLSGCVLTMRTDVPGRVEPAYLP
ncbi:MAG TPA: SMP-30/gluconolactonase/LRE family protein [Noviherbaspirillum sp.]|jgi:sugar lactone lactonase YvrE|uniref:SMP-30/gluconolactonase/LRE family protein n=1 Tax=Noviherbaspirillum sp. TaxID=1926288 RepID=UPI002F92FCE4